MKHQTPFRDKNEDYRKYVSLMLAENKTPLNFSDWKASATPSPLPETGVNIDTPTEAAEVFEYLDGPDGNFASESAPKGWETGAPITPGNEREEGEGQTLLSQYEKYIEYCDEMIGQMVVPIRFVEWREFKKYPHL